MPATGMLPLFGRLSALTAGFAVVAGFLTVLTLDFRPPPMAEQAPAIAYTNISFRPPPPAAEKKSIRLRRARVEAPAVLEDLQPNDAAALRAALACLNPRIEERPPWCATMGRDRRASEFDQRGALALHAAPKAPNRPANLDGIFTRAEQQTIVMPLCTGMCAKVGKPPPPPTRTPEELCRAAGIGPCTEAPLRINPSVP